MLALPAAYSLGLLSCKIAAVTLLGEIQNILCKFSQQHSIQHPPPRRKASPPPHAMRHGPAPRAHNRRKNSAFTLPHSCIRQKIVAVHGCKFHHNHLYGKVVEAIGQEPPLRQQSGKKRGTRARAFKRLFDVGRRDYSFGQLRALVVHPCTILSLARSARCVIGVSKAGKARRDPGGCTSHGCRQCRQCRVGGG